MINNKLINLWYQSYIIDNIIFLTIYLKSLLRAFKKIIQVDDHQIESRIKNYIVTLIINSQYNHKKSSLSKITAKINHFVNLSSRNLNNCKQLRCSASTSLSNLTSKFYLKQTFTSQTTKWLNNTQFQNYFFSTIFDITNDRLQASHK